MLSRLTALLSRWLRRHSATGPIMIAADGRWIRQDGREV